ncbi:D-alanine--D-alanine ligase [Pseudonocardia abyssalis]|uniref:D-alanine--D-alanine ligase n=1 Tax=Pseudonocardia abyssalis TaxID=2792008 RepID=A0ABS6UNZ5_9PSEU|nr:D-alanine--D-alanine ligase [Pseudonocardia abyssalis]MBW0117130.1 D-alanine--D-alanine ligase [Pseudonocardia abyssalis]MBW0133947.1 D-alanine--D-alanine ligase [Pseudonocardia abyssalis]
MPVHVLHLVGSAVDDAFCDLSCLYARDALHAVTDPRRYRHSVAHVGPDGRWRFPSDLERTSIAAAVPMTPGGAVAYLAALDVDLVLPQMFCRPGMTSYRALFDVLRIPYLGNTAEVMALAAHKGRAKAVVAAAGVAVPTGELLRPGDRPTVAVPAVVKPVDADNSDGVALVTDVARFDDALAGAFAHSSEVLVESYVELGREVRCGIVVSDGELRCLPLEEYALDRVRTRADKLGRDADGDLYLVAKDPTRSWIVDPGDPVTSAVHDAARRCFAALGCRHYGLFDFRVDPDGRPWFLEAGPYCSYASTSVVTVMARAAGIALPELFAMGVAQALAGPR